MGPRTFPGRRSALGTGDSRNDGGRLATAGANGGKPDWMAPFARAIEAAKKYVVSSTLERVDWNADSCAEIRGGRSARSSSRVRNCSWEA